MRTYKTKRCRIRQDIFNRGESVPLNEGERYLFQGNTFEYRWQGNKQLQIKWSKRWWDAQSIDFEFLN